MADKNIVVGAKFPDFESIFSTLNHWEEKNYVSLSSRCSESINSSSKRGLLRAFQPCLKVGERDFACIHSSRELQSKSKDQRPNQR